MKLTHELCEEYFAQQSIERKRAIMLLILELDSAEEKHPVWPEDFITKAAIVSEEAGELLKAALQHKHEKGRYYDMMKEAAQTGAMALRFILNQPELPLKR